MWSVREGFEHPAKQPGWWEAKESCHSGGQRTPGVQAGRTFLLPPSPSSGEAQASLGLKPEQAQSRADTASVPLAPDS